MKIGGIVCSLLILVGPLIALGDEDIEISKVQRDQQGFSVHAVESPHQAGGTEIRVLLPDRIEDGKRYPVVYVLPVEPGRENRFGDGLLEVKKHDLHNKHGVLFVAPTFSNLPWYADHLTKSELRQESHFLKVVLPIVEQTYPVSKEPRDRLLLGFSKSGWGAFTLLLRHPDHFGRAAAWDAPLMMTQIGKYSTGDILGTQECFDNYRPDHLIQMNAEKLRREKRLILTGYGNFREHHQQAHALLDKLQIPHEYRDGPRRTATDRSGSTTGTAVG
ncbi:alpha/beta hydrolase-fold protein [Rosistilla oblonga]|uniref:alpha/beta hydrolase-fold protein n=1 Tax=Rosistilla oblonga TaxID=2527990 RepID=UPI003A969EE6